MVNRCKSSHSWVFNNDLIVSCGTLVSMLCCGTTLNEQHNAPGAPNATEPWHNLGGLRKGCHKGTRTRLRLEFWDGHTCGRGIQSDVFNAAWIRWREGINFLQPAYSPYLSVGGWSLSDDRAGLWGRQGLLDDYAGFMVAHPWVLVLAWACLAVQWDTLWVQTSKAGGCERVAEFSPGKADLFSTIQANKLGPWPLFG